MTFRFASGLARLQCDFVSHIRCCVKETYVRLAAIVRGWQQQRRSKSTGVKVICKENQFYIQLIYRFVVAKKEMTFHEHVQGHTTTTFALV